MRKLLLPIGLVMLAVPLVLFLVWDTQTRTLGNELLAALTAAKPKVIARNPPPRVPLHDNGFKCLGSMLDVTPGDLGPFSSKQRESLNALITGEKPISELSGEVRASMLALSPWAVSLRDCGDSMQLAWVDGLTPWTKVTHPRWVRLSEATPALIEFTALELRVLNADGQPEVALERCSATWAMVADQSHLGLLGALYARMAVRRLAPACGEALAAVPAEIRTQVAKTWAPLANRLASSREVMEGQRMAVALEAFAWVSDEAIRQQLGESLSAGSPGLSSRVRTGRTWRAWDEVMRELVAVADVPGPDRLKKSEAVDEIASAGYAKYLTSYEETSLLLGLLADLAAGGSKPLPAGVTKEEKALAFVNAHDQKLLIPTSK